MDYRRAKHYIYNTRTELYKLHSARMAISQEKVFIV